ncbi:hypothetical protein B7494_g138 [Chlorociboria aeruginascens]|nr:hypothetical protein B7494_g138 [Chlorociboria aeruginascens]
MAGVRGFSDPNVQVNADGKNTFQQLVPDSLSTEASTLLPWYINYLGGNWTESTQCTGAGSNSFQANHACLNNELNNLWAVNNTPLSWSYFQRQDLPIHFSLAESWTVADMYQEGVIAATEPNRVTWMTGSINCPGGPQEEDQGGTVLDNNSTPGCEAAGFACFPFSWKTVPEYHQDANVTWMVYQDEDNYGDDALSSFVQYQNAPQDSPLTQFGNSYPGLQQFYDDAMSGNLPQVSWIVGPAELSEHVPYLPRDGAWLQKNIVDAVVHGAAYNETVLIISYDESGGWGDHVTPYHSPAGTAGEWLNVENDVFGYLGQTYTGPGYRLPFYIISPWTRGGHVFTEHADHNSQIMFVEQWLDALGYVGATTEQMPAWRRAHMSNLIKAFDFDHPDYSIPIIPDAITPSTDSDGTWDGAALCQDTYGNPPAHPPTPFGAANEALDPATLSEEGYKSVRGYLTEGRYLVFEMNGYALSNSGNGSVKATTATADHAGKSQRWVVYAMGGTMLEGGEGPGIFVLESAVDRTYIAGNGALVVAKAGAENYTIEDLGNGAGYSLMGSQGQYLGVSGNGSIALSGQATGWSVFSVTYQS